MKTEEKLKTLLETYINEELDSSDMKKIRRLIRVEIANVLFDLFKKRGVWI
jgi:hypothetical protein